MEAPKQKVNAKRFVQDFRSGKTLQELLRAHGLNKAGLQKLLKILVERGLLEASEVRQAVRRAQTQYKPSVADSVEKRIVPAAQPGAEERPAEVSGACPQCGAGVTEKALTCPECGHVLPGEHRWDTPDQDKGLLARIPRKLVGWGLAIPFAVAILLTLKEFVIPLTGVVADKKSGKVEQILPEGKTPIGAAQELAAKRARDVLETEVTRALQEGIISAVAEDYTSFMTGPSWSGMTSYDQAQFIITLRSAMRRSSVPINFDVVDAFGKPVARVTENAVEMGSLDQPQELRPIDTGEDEPGQSPPRASMPPGLSDALKKAVGGQLPQGPGGPPGTEE